MILLLQNAVICLLSLTACIGLQREAQESACPMIKSLHELIRVPTKSCMPHLPVFLNLIGMNPHQPRLISPQKSPSHMETCDGKLVMAHLTAV